MRIVFIGAGNVATHLSEALKEIGCSIIQVFSRSKNSAETLSNRIQCPYSYGDYDSIRRDAEVYIVSISDNALNDISDNIININPNALWLHTSGSLSIDIFKCKRRGVLYPLQSFSKQRKLSTRNIPFLIESNNDEDLKTIISFCESISKTVYVMESEKRRLIHLSAVFCCNFVNHCFTIANDILSKNEIPFELLYPLINETIDKMYDLGPTYAQTGPAIRYDTNVIEKHMNLLKGDEITQNVYSVLSKSIYKHHLQNKI